MTVDELLALGHRPDEPDETRFNMAVMGLRLAARRNGVAALHGAVSREMFAGLWPDVPIEEVPIGSVTNGVHAPTWVSPELDDLLTRRVLPDWDGASAADWARVADVGDDELWRALQQGRERLVNFVRERLRTTRLAQGFSASDVAWTSSVLDPTVMTVGFARRFATYKRATLLLSQPQRLRSILFHPERPVQFVFAGKAHPADQPGKEMIQAIQHFAAQHEVRHRFVFLDDYDMAVARALLPRRGHLAEHPSPAAGGVRDERHEGGPERRAELLDPRRLVGRVVRRPERLGHHVRRGDRGRQPPGRASR